jgi:hypothetical protein
LPAAGDLAGLVVVEDFDFPIEAVQVPYQGLYLDGYSWRVDQSDLKRPTLYDYLMHGKADCKRISCATLCIAGEGEAAITHQMANKCFAELPHPQKKLLILTVEEGGEAHCQVNNLPLLNRVIFDWLELVG